MFLPDKTITVDQALLTVGGQILSVIETPMTISSLLDAVRQWRVTRGISVTLPFWWFALALDSLFALRLIEIRDETIHRSSLA